MFDIINTCTTRTHAIVVSDEIRTAIGIFYVPGPNSIIYSENESAHDVES